MYTKYGSQKVLDRYGNVFDSKKEYRRWIQLKDMEKHGEISDLKRQWKYELIPSQKIDGKVVERAVNYFADFVYEENGETVVEDSKGFKTADYIIKRKLMLYKYGIRIKET